MSVLELGTALVTPFELRRRAPDRRPPPEAASRSEVPEAPGSPPPAPFHAPVVIPDLSQLTPLREAAPQAAATRPAERDVYACLDRLVAAIREGDLALARAVAESLETQMRAERGGGAANARRGDFARAATAAPLAVEAIYDTLAHYLVTEGAA